MRMAFKNRTAYGVFIAISYLVEALLRCAEKMCISDLEAAGFAIAWIVQCGVFADGCDAGSLAQHP